MSETTKTAPGIDPAAVKDTATQAANDAVADVRERMVGLESRINSFGVEFTEWTGRMTAMSIAVTDAVAGVREELSRLGAAHRELADAVTAPDSADTEQPAPGVGKLAEMLAALRNEVDHLKRAARGGW